MAKKDIKITATPLQLEAAFTEWLRRWQEDAAATRDHALSMLTCKPRTYGEEVTPYFISLLDELAEAQA